MYREDGSDVDADTAASIVWRGGEPLYNEFTAQSERVDELQSAVNEVRGIEVELGGIRAELTDNDDPPTRERLETLQDRIEELRSKSEALLPNRNQNKVDQDAGGFSRGKLDGKAVPDIKIGG